MDLSSRRLAANLDLVMNYTCVCSVRALRRGTRHGRSTRAHNRDFFSQLGDIDSIGTSKSCQPLPLRFGASEPLPAKSEKLAFPPKQTDRAKF